MSDAVLVYLGDTDPESDPVASAFRRVLAQGDIEDDDTSSEEDDDEPWDTSELP